MNDCALCYVYDSQGSMCYGSSVFDQDIGGWNVSSGTNFVGASMVIIFVVYKLSQVTHDYFLLYFCLHFQDYMFHAASAFDQNLCRWDKKDSASDGNFCSEGASCGPSICSSSPPFQSPSSLPMKDPTEEPTSSPSHNAASNSIIGLAAVIGSTIAFGIVVA